MKLSLKLKTLKFLMRKLKRKLLNLQSSTTWTAANIKQALGGLDNLKTDLKIRKAVEILVDNSKTVA